MNQWLDLYIPAGRIILLFALAAGGIWDVCSRSVPKMYLLSLEILAGLYGAVGLLWGLRGPGEILLSLFPGIFLLIMRYLTKNKIGMADARVFCASGLFLDPMSIAVVLMAALILTVPPSLYLLVVCRKGRNAKLPFLTFAFGGYVAYLFLCYN